MSHFTVAVFSHDPDDVDSILAPFDENVDKDSEYAEFVEDEECDIDEETGLHGYWANPNAKWDWYVEGGRWSGLLALKNNKAADCAPVRECVFGRDEEAYQHALRFWEVVVEKQPLRLDENEEDFSTFWKPTYFSSRYKDKYDYAASEADFGTYAFVTPDGEWHEQGEMGWFGCDNATQDSISSYHDSFKKYLETAKAENLYISIVDCHI